MKKLSIVIALLVSAIGIAQVDVIGPADGLLLDTKTSTVLNGIGNPREGLLVGNKTTHSLWYYNGTQFIDLMVVASGGSTYTAGDGLTLTGTDFGIADAGVTNLKLQNGSVTNDKIAFFTINPTRLNVNVNQNPVPADMVPVTLAADEFTFKPYITSPFSSSITGYRFAPNLLYFDQIHIKNKTQDNSVATSSITLSSVEDPDNSGDYYGYIGLAKPSTGAGDRITGVPSSYSVLGTTNNVKIGQATSTAPAEKLFVEGNIDITGDYLINGTPIGSGGGTDDQTLPEVLTEGNDAGGEDVLNVGILNLSDKNSDTGTWDITEQTSSTYSGDLAFRNSSAGSSINRAFIPHDGIIEHSAHLTTKLYVDNAISNSGGGSLTTDQSNILANQLKGPVTEIIASDGAFTNSSIRRISGVDISRPVNNVVNSGDVVYTLGDLGETSGSLNGETIYAKVEGNTATLTIDPNNIDFYEEGIALDNKRVFLDAGGQIFFENNTIGGWDIMGGNYTLIDGSTVDPYSTNANPNLATEALAFGTSSALFSGTTNSFGSTTISVVTATEHPYTNTHAIRVTADSDGTLRRTAFDFTVEDATVYEVAVARKAGTSGSGRYRLAIGATDTHDTNFANTTDFVVDTFEITTNDTQLRFEGYAAFGTAETGDYSDYFIIIKKK